MKELLADEHDSDESDSNQEEIEALEEQMAFQLAQNTGSTNNNENSSVDEWIEDDILNILVIGCDTRKKGG